MPDMIKIDSCEKTINNETLVPEVKITLTLNQESIVDHKRLYGEQSLINALGYILFSMR